MANIVIVPSVVEAGSLSATQYDNNGQNVVVNGVNGDVIGLAYIPAGPKSVIPPQLINHFYDYQQWYCDGPTLIQDLSLDMILRKFLSFADFRNALDRDFNGVILVQKCQNGWRLCLCDPHEGGRYGSWLMSFDDIVTVRISMNGDIDNWLAQNCKGEFTCGWEGYGASAKYTIRCRLESDAALVKLRFG